MKSTFGRAAAAAALVTPSSTVSTAATIMIIGPAVRVPSTHRSRVIPDAGAKSSAGVFNY
jgi:hypothetical protein